MRVVLTSVLTALFAIGLLALRPATAEADSGTFALTAGGLRLEQAGDAAWHPNLRAELAFRVAGPLQLGGYVEGTALDLPFDQPAFGAGLLATLRPELPILGIVPSVQASAGRLQLPSEVRGRVDGWSTSLGAGIGLPLGPATLLEGRVLRSWYHDLEAQGALGDDSWTVSAGVAVQLP